MEVAEKNIDLLQLNMTGMRIIVLFSLLLESPKTVEEINEAYDKNPLIKDKVSYDTIRNDINALRDAGCVIARTTKSNNKYILQVHPFDLEISTSVLNALKKVYNKIYSTLSFEKLFEFDVFFKVLSDYVKNDEIKEALLKISKISNINKAILKDLLNYCSKRNQITILYKSQTGTLKEHCVICEKVAFRHDKLYFFGVDLTYGKNVFYMVNKIDKILDVNLKSEKREFKKFKAKYKILNISLDNYLLSKNEKLLEVDGNDLIIEAETDNDFIMFQNILNFGKNCVVLEPLELKNMIIENLKLIRKKYTDEE